MFFLSLYAIFKNESHIIKEGYFPYYDVELVHNGEIKKYECKADRYAYKTGQIAIESECNNKPSGITRTKADYYAYFVVKPYGDLYDLYLIPVSVLKQRIKAKQFMRKIVCGHNKNTKCLVMDINTFAEYKHTSKK